MRIRMTPATRRRLLAQTAAALALLTAALAWEPTVRALRAVAALAVRA